MSEFSQADYEAEVARVDRKITNLSASLDEAKSRFTMVHDPEQLDAIKREQEAALKAVEEAQDERAALDLRRRGVAYRERVQDSGQTDADRQAAISAIAEADLKQRKAFLAIVDAMLPIAKFMEDYLTARATLNELAREHEYGFSDDRNASRDQLISFIAGLNDVRQETDFLAGLLTEVGLSEFGLGHKNAWLQMIRDRDVKVTAKALLERQTDVRQAFANKLKDIPAPEKA